MFIRKLWPSPLKKQSVPRPVYQTERGPAINRLLWGYDGHAENKPAVI